MLSARGAHRAGALVLVAALVGPLMVLASQRPASASSPVLFGGSPGQRGTETKLDALARFEAESQRRVAIVRAYARWDTPWPDVLEEHLAANDQIEHLSLKPKFDVPPAGTSNVIPWSSIAGAQPGSALYGELVGWADRLRDYGRPILFTFHHEPEGDSGYGTSADYVAAWRRVVDVFRSEGATNVTFVWTMTASSFSRTDSKAAGLWYPGDTYVDALGVDGYNFYGCRGGTPVWKTTGEIFQPFLTWAGSHPNESLVIAEWGSLEDPADPTRKGGWIADAQATFQGPDWGRLIAVEYWNSQGLDYPDCQYWVDSSPASLGAWQQMAAQTGYSATTVPGTDTGSSGSPSPTASPSASASPEGSSSPSPSPSPSPISSPSPSPSPSAQPPTTPAQPTGISNDLTSIDLSWPASTDPDGGPIAYRVYRDAGTTPIATVQGAGGVVAYHDAPLASGSTHTYAVQAVDAEGHESAIGPTSAPIVVRAAPSAPGTPTGAPSGTSTIDLSWAAATDADDTSLAYQVFRDGQTSPVATVAGPTAGTISYRDAGLQAGSSHTYAVRAVDAAGNAGPTSGTSSAITTFVFTDAFGGGLGAWPVRSNTATLDQTFAPAPGGTVPTLRLTAKNSAAYARHDLPTAYASVCLQASFDVSSISKKQATLVGFRTSGGSAIGRVLIDPTTRRLIAHSDVSGASTTSSASIALGTWTTVDVCAVTGAAGSWTVRVNGVTAIAAWTTNNGSAGIGRVQLGDESPRTFVANADDVIVHR